ncbi:MAG: GTP cyclohydrolase I FolE [Treponema sp.]|jgi:GTP cyclohydrolase I|nr:GTP cyclohydrolase I FolE [Treponema sp.]
MINKEGIERAIRELLKAIGDDPDREGLKETPARVARMYEEIFAGIDHDPMEEIKLFKEDSIGNMVAMKDIPFYSMCEHHLMPFFGHIHVVYIPKNGNILGLSKIARIADVLAKKPQLQERLTQEIGDVIMKGTGALGTAVVIEAEHLCMTMRGIRKPGAQTLTSDFKGRFQTDSGLRAEALGLIRR